MEALAGTQAWMQQAILAGSAAEARAHIRGDNRLTAEARIGIYANGYRLRLIECLEGEYPVLAALVGPTVFGLFAQGYIAAYPSHSYTLYDFGAGFPDWLEAVRPRGDGTPQAAEAVPAAIARVERAKAEILRAEGVEPQAPQAHGGLDPLIATMLGLARYRRPDSVRLLALPFDVTETLAGHARGDALPFPAPVPSLMGVARADYRAACHALEPLQYDWLASLPETGGAPADSRLLAWLPVALAKGLVARA